MNNSICIECHKFPESVRFTFLGRLRTYCDAWRLTALFLAVGTVLPLAVILFSFLHPQPEIWRHLAQNLLTDLLVNTAVLTAGVLTGTFVLGVSLAWLTGVCDFPGRKLFTWALLLPLAIPTYVLAFVMIGIFDFSGPVQSQLRSWFPAQFVWFPNIRSTGGVIAVMTLALYPYVYLLARSAFKSQGKRAHEAAQSLGYSRMRSFFKVALPTARPWIAGGLMLVLMETLADFGAVSIFNYDTFTTAIYKAWYGFFSLPAAAQLSSFLVIMVLVIIVIEQRLRRNRRFTQSGRFSMEADRIVLTGWKKWAAASFASGVVTAAFLLPVAQIIGWSVKIFPQEFSGRYAGYFGRSVFFALLAALAVGICALLLAYARRRHKDTATTVLIRIATLGYALPGTVLAVGIVIAIAFCDQVLAAFMNTLTGVTPSPLIQGTVLTVLAAYAVRFMAAGFNAIDSAMQRITPNLDEASISLGVKGPALLRRVHLPILRGGILTAAIMVFVDVLKEMPITLMTRPFGWDTLAVKIFELTAEGQWERAALPAVALVMGGLAPIILLTRQMDK